jgi:hypothetical protein
MTVDLSLAAPLDCLPIAAYRVVLREQAWLRRECVRGGDQAVDGAPLALLATETEDALDTTALRPARLAITTNMDQSIGGRR